MTKSKMRKSEHAEDELTLMPDPTAPIWKSELTNRQIVCKMPWLALWLKNWRTEAVSLDQPPRMMRDPKRGYKIEDQLFHG